MMVQYILSEIKEVLQDILTMLISVFALVIMVLLLIFTGWLLFGIVEFLGKLFGIH